VELNSEGFSERGGEEYKKSEIGREKGAEAGFSKKIEKHEGRKKKSSKIVAAIRERHRQRKHRTREKSTEGEERRDQITVNYTRLQEVS